jgi:hypothetical protein
MLRTARAQESIGDFFFFERADPTSGEDRGSITTLADENYVSGAGGLTFRCSNLPGSGHGHHRSLCVR